jgi:hypothetical protein
MRFRNGFGRTLAAVAVACALLLGAGAVRRSPYYDAVRFAHALRSGDPEAALQWVDVPSVAASILDAAEEVWLRERVGPPDRYPLAPLLRPLLQMGFGLTRPLAQRRVEDRIRALVRAIATGTPDAPVQIPRWGGWPVTVIGVVALARLEPLPEGRVRLSIGWGRSPVCLVLARRGDRWTIVAVDRSWLATVLPASRNLPPAPRPSTEPARP